MRIRDLVSSITWMALGGLFVVGALQQGLIRRGVPGPGFFPFFSGLALIFVSLFVLIPALVHRERAESSDSFRERHRSGKLLLAVAALFAFGIAMQYAGYFVASLLFMFFTAWLVEPKRWRTAALVALLAAILSYMLFVVLLGVQLPKGLLDF